VEYRLIGGQASSAGASRALAVHMVRRGRIFEPRLALHFKMHSPSDYRDHPHNLIRLFCLTLNGHKVRQLGHSFFRKKSRNKDVRIRQVELTNTHIRQLRLDLKSASLLFIKLRSKNGRGVEVWITKKVDGAIHTD
jgi:hypothetical protein